MSGGPIDKIVKSVGSGIGFVSEARKYKIAKKIAVKEREREQYQLAEESPRSSSPHSLPSYTEFPEEKPQGSSSPEPVAEQDEIERSWQLDEAQDAIVEPIQPRKSKSGVGNPDKIVAGFLKRQLPSYGPSSGLDPTRPVYKLQYPVAIPQRRPKDKTRGFIRAYAPDLQNVGIEQAVWLDFIDTFNEASLANPWINALNLASMAAMPLPTLASTAISIAVMVATTIAMETQGRYRQNKALDKINEEFFRPRGLFCLVMTWDVESTSSRTNMNINSTIQNTMQTQGRTSHKFQSSNGVTNGMESIQTAELVFPGLDFLASIGQEDQAGLKMKMKRGKLFVDDYLDRKAQAKFIEENPDSYLNQAGKPKFLSKYADPTHRLHKGVSGNMSGGQGGLLGGGGRDDFMRSRGYGRGSDVRGQYCGRGGMEAQGPIGGIIQLIGMAAKSVSDHRQSKNNPNNTSSPPAANGEYSGFPSSRGNLANEKSPPAPCGNSQPEYHGTTAEVYDERVRQQPQYATATGGSEWQQPQYQQSVPQYQQTIPPLGSEQPVPGGAQQSQNQQSPRPGRQQQQNQRAGVSGGLNLGKLFSSKVLYLMVVNMPTEDEMAQAKQLTANWNVQSRSQELD